MICFFLKKNLEIKWKLNSNDTTKKTPVIVTFLVQLQVWEFTVSRKRDTITDDFLWKFWSLQNIIFTSTEVAGWRFLISSNILNVSLSLSVINEFNHNLLSGASKSSCSRRFTVFGSGNFYRWSSENSKGQG